MNKKEILSKTRDYVRWQLERENLDAGHDWWHIQRVVDNALLIGKQENAGLFIVELAALLHDIGDFKFHNGDETAGSRLSGKWLQSLEVPETIISHVCEIVRDVSFKGAGEITRSRMRSLEGKVVQDADRLDAMGAVGIARAFVYSGFKGREIYNPSIKPQKQQNFEEYKNSSGPAINHFYEKLLLLKDLMNTGTGKQMAEDRHIFMLRYLEQFFEEWNFS
jgi:uncharacterized protein